MTEREPRVGVFGWGIVAPRSRDVGAFERNLESAGSWLEPFNGFGPDNFLVGTSRVRARDLPGLARRSGSLPPASRRSRARWGCRRSSRWAPSSRRSAQNPGLEHELERLGALAHVYVGTGVGDLPTIYEASLRLDRAQARWDRFWADPARNEPLRRFLADPSTRGDAIARRRRGAAVDPSALDGEAREDAERAWNHYWAARSPALAEYLAELRAIEGADVVGEVEAAKKSLIRQKRSANNKLQEKWGAPTPPWDDRLLANVIWNIHNTPASNISMVGRITGFTFAPVGACATFGVTLRLAMNAIRLGQAKAVVIGAADPPPHPLLVGAFYNGRVISADGEVSRPLTGLRGTHVSGGAAIWIVGDLEHMTARGFRPIGLEPIAVGVSADAEHIITPSEDGPLASDPRGDRRRRSRARERSPPGTCTPPRPRATGRRSPT